MGSNIHIYSSPVSESHWFKKFKEDNKMKKVFEKIDECVEMKLNFIVIGTGRELNKTVQYLAKYKFCPMPNCMMDSSEYLLFARPNRCGDELTHSNNIHLLSNSEYKDFIRINIESIKSEDNKMKSEWRPKKGEMIEVSSREGVWAEKEFRVFMDGNYYVLCNQVLIPYKVARPIQKDMEKKPEIQHYYEVWFEKNGKKIDVGNFDNVEGTEHYRIAKSMGYIEGITGYLQFKRVSYKKPEPKFKVGDIVTDGKNGVGKIFGIDHGLTYLVEFDGGSGGYEEEQLEKVPTFPVEDGKISFRGLSKGIMVDKNIVMYYSYRYDRILISETEKPLPKKYVWVKIGKSELNKGDIFTSGCSKDLNRFFIFNKLISGDTISGFEYSEANGYNGTVGFGNDEIYKAIEV